MEPTTTIIFFVILDQLILPTVFTIWMVKRSYRSKIDWVFQFLITASFIFYIFSIGRWHWVSYYLRYFWIVLFLLASYLSYKKLSAFPFFKRMKFKGYILISFIIFYTVVLSVINLSAIKGFFIEDEPLDLAFPLKNGSYYVSQGGNSIKINHHLAYSPQKYALDIVKLNPFGTRAKGIFPKKLSRFEIYEDILFSPCDGEVINAIGDRPDMPPLEMDNKRPLGNHVAINNNGIVVYLAHMLKGSLLVKKGDLVEVGQPIGKVGNSGNSSEPHLHIHAEKESQGIPLTFGGKFLVRNSVI